MARFSRMEVYNRLYGQGILPIFNNEDKAITANIAAACITGGATVIEYTNRGDYALDVFSDLVQYIAKNFSSAIIGAGTVTDPSTAALYIAHGAEFIVAPSFNRDTAKLCNKKRIPYVPGCMTPTEIEKAEEYGCEIIKIFPADAVGSGFIKAIKGPYPRTSLLITGGVTPDEKSLREWFEAGASIVGLGSRLIKNEYITNGNFTAIQDTVCLCCTIIQEIKKRVFVPA